METFYSRPRKFEVEQVAVVKLGMNMAVVTILAVLDQDMDEGIEFSEYKTQRDLDSAEIWSERVRC